MKLFMTLAACIIYVVLSHIYCDQVFPGYDSRVVTLDFQFLTLKSFQIVSSLAEIRRRKCGFLPGLLH